MDKPNLVDYSTVSGHWEQDLPLSARRILQATKREINLNRKKDNFSPDILQVAH